MDKQTNDSIKLWPVIEPNDRLPFSPALWTLLNVMLAVVIALPYVFVLAAAGVGLYLVNGLHGVLDASFTHHALAFEIAANAMKVFIVLFAGRMEYLMVGFVGYLVREARDAAREFSWE